MSQINTILFDIGDVLVSVDFERAFRKFEELNDGKEISKQQRQQFFAKKNHYETGAISDGQWLDFLRSHFACNCTDEEMRTIYSDIFGLNQAMANLLPELNQQFQLLHLSNISAIHLQYIRESYPVFSYIPEGGYSYQMGAIKPDPSIYQKIIATYNLQPEKTLYIDDLAANIEAGGKFGLLCHHYQATKHNDLLAALAEHKIIC